jgi:hypothetical protein
MAEESKQPDANTLIQASAPLHRRAMGMGVGVPLGTLIFLATLASMTRDVQPEEHLALLAQYFVGYSVSFTGALIGLVWGFVLVSLPSRDDTEQYTDFLDHL